MLLLVLAHELESPVLDVRYKLDGPLVLLDGAKVLA